MTARRRQPAAARRRTIAFAVVVGLLLGQLLGLAHRISHGVLPVAGSDLLLVARAGEAATVAAAAGATSGHDVADFGAVRDAGEAAPPSGSAFAWLPAHDGAAACDAFDHASIGALACDATMPPAIAAHAPPAPPVDVAAGAPTLPRHHSLARGPPASPAV